MKSLNWVELVTAVNPVNVDIWDNVAISTILYWTPVYNEYRTVSPGQNFVLKLLTSTFCEYGSKIHSVHDWK